MGIGKHLIKRMTTWSAAVIYVHSFLIKKKCVQTNRFFLLLQLSKVASTAVV